MPMAPYAHPRLVASFHSFSPSIEATPQQLRWDPLAVADEAQHDFVDGLSTLGGAGDSQVKDGLAIHFYSFTRNMDRKSFYNSDGDMLIGVCPPPLPFKCRLGWLTKQQQSPSRASCS